jgi:uncharacterized membrane protein YgcG
MKHLSSLLLGLGLIFGLTSSVAAETWTIDSYSTSLSLGTDGVLSVKEDITANFSSDQHGIFRDIPFAYQDSARGNRYYMKFSDIAVTRNAASEPFEQETSSTTLRVRIGDADNTVRGSQLYGISYRAEGTVSEDETAQYLNWDSVGDQWAVPVENATTTITLPPSIPVSTVSGVCYVGIQGSTNGGGCTITQDPTNNALISQANTTITPGTSYTINLALPAGAVPVTAITENPYALSASARLSILVGSVIGGLGLFLVNFITWYNHGRDSKRLRSIAPVFASPKELRPAEFGALLRQGSSIADISATIIDFARRGLITIEQRASGVLIFKKKETVLAIASYPPAGSLLPYESYIRTNFIGSNIGDQSVYPTTDERMAQYAQEAQSLIMKSTVMQECIEASTPARWVHGATIVCGALLTIPAFIGLSEDVSLAWLPLLLVGIGLVVTGIVFFALSKRFTARGHELRYEALGYKLFMEKAETHRQKFLEDGQLYEQLIPYAVSIGIVSQLTKKLESMNVPTPQPVWFIGSDFSAGSLGQISSDVSTALSSSISSASSSGGGGAGSGGGGGGGGSW